MFYGEYEHTIDKKGRLIIPSKFRDSFKEYDIEKFYITRGLDKCLFLFTENEWKTQESKFKSVSFTKSECSDIFEQAKNLLYSTNDSIRKRSFKANPSQTNCKFCLFRPACSYFLKQIETYTFYTGNTK